MNKTYMNQAERFIVQNREQFDTENIPETVWEKIQLPEADKHLKKSAVLKPLYKWSIAAVSTGIIFLSVYFLIQKPNHQINNTTENQLSTNTEVPKHNSANDSDVDNEIAATDNEVQDITPTQSPKIETIYKSIAVKQDELKSIASIYPELYKQFSGDLATLDSSYRMLKSQAANSSLNRDVIIKAMIQNLQLQAELLNRQLQIINQFKNVKNKKNETSSNNKINI